MVRGLVENSFSHPQLLERASSASLKNMANGPEKNMVHEDEIWRQQLKEEVEAAKTWKSNWGFLGDRSEAEPRGFSTAVAKYQKPGGGWTVKSIRVTDNTDAGVAAATSEQNARTLMTSLTAETKPRAPMQPCTSKVGRPVRAASCTEGQPC